MSEPPAANPQHRPLRVLITAGPTHEAIDAVRFLGNRSSGRLGIELAESCLHAGLTPHLLLGPTHLAPTSREITATRFESCQDLQALLERHLPACDVLVMAAAVADYRPKPTATLPNSKLRRTASNLQLDLEPTPDLLKLCSERRRPDQTLIGFALEPQDEVETSARAKLERKGVDAIVGNPLETMESSGIDAILVLAGRADVERPGPMSKSEFAAWLCLRLQEVHHGRRPSPASR